MANARKGPQGLGLAGMSLDDLLKGNIDELLGGQITGDEVAFHDDPKIILPRGMTFGEAFSLLERLQDEAETPTSWDRKFLYRSNDGAWATFNVIKARYGMLMGKVTYGFFGNMIPSETREISIGIGDKRQVPWGTIDIPALKGLEIVLCDAHKDPDFGSIFELHVSGPRKWKEEVEALFADIEEELRVNSIYRGHAIIGSGNPEFLDLRGFKADQIVFADDVELQLEGLLHTPLRYTKEMKAQGLPLKRAALLEGPFGTGKTSEGMILAQIAVANGWTFISAKPGRDKVEDVLRTARLYQPAVVFVEDIDGMASSGEDEDVTKMLDAFDGIAAKGGELFVVLTTNHVERIHKGMLRPGRLDAVIHIAELDKGGVTRLIKAVIAPSRLEDNVDFDAVYAAMTGFLPAFVREAINRALTVSIGRAKGATNSKIGTDDLVTAAHSLHSQLKQLEEAGEGTRKPALEVAVESAVRNAVKDLAVFDPRAGNSAAIVEATEQTFRPPAE